jgi:glycosyltransferase involved in cell wall biosynthesis
MKKIAFLPDLVNLRYPGYLKILDPILQRSINYRITNEDELIDASWQLVPFGVHTSYQYSNRGLDVAYLVDSVSLGYGSVFLFYLKRYKFFHPEMWLNLLRYIKYAPQEKRIVSGYRKVIVASKHDAEFMNKRYGKSNVIAITNGVDLDNKYIDTQRVKSNSEFSYKIGMLNYWGAGKPHDFTWFVDEILPVLRKRFPKIRIILAGRGGSENLKEYFAKNGCEYVGEVENISDFFSSIDIFLTSMRKECGILNKVLDAFVNRKIIIGFEPNMKAFSDLHNGFMTYNNARELIAGIEYIRDNPVDITIIENNAYQYVLSNHNWDTKMQEFELVFSGTAIL